MLYIVSGKQTRFAAEALEARIDAGASPAAGDGTELWTVRDYLKGADALAADDALVFLGAADAWAHETQGGEVRYDRFGMRCTVRGRRALLTAAEGPISARRERRAFLDYVRAERPEIPAESLERLAAERRIALFDAVRATVNPFSLVLEQQASPPPGSADLSELGQLQYRVLALIFASSLLPDVLAGV